MSSAPSLTRWFANDEFYKLQLKYLKLNIIFFVKEGMKGFYRGLTPTLIGMAPYAGEYWCLKSLSPSHVWPFSSLSSLSFSRVPSAPFKVSHSSPSAPWRALAWSISQIIWDVPRQTTLMSLSWEPTSTCCVEGLLVPLLRLSRKHHRHKEFKNYD